jgi:hypothetical protein
MAETEFLWRLDGKNGLDGIGTQRMVLVSRNGGSCGKPEIAALPGAVYLVEIVGSIS